METKSLLFGLIGFMLGGLLVATAATTFDKPKPDAMTMDQMSSSLSSLSGDTFDQAYINNMIDHHQGAIDMAKLAATRAKHDEIKALSRDIITAQEKEIAHMNQWRVTWGYSTTDTMKDM